MKYNQQGFFVEKFDIKNGKSTFKEEFNENTKEQLRVKKREREAYDLAHKEDREILTAYFERGF